MAQNSHIPRKYTFKKRLRKMDGMSNSVHNQPLNGLNNNDKYLEPVNRSKNSSPVPINSRSDKYVFCPAGIEFSCEKLLHNKFTFFLYFSVERHQSREERREIMILITSLYHTRLLQQRELNCSATKKYQHQSK